MLPEKPCCVGPTIDDRKAWDAAAAHRAFRKCVDSAQKLLAEPIPKLTDDLYLDFSRTGNRQRCQYVQRNRLERVNTLVLAECLENRGRFLPAIEEVILAVCSEKSWTLPAHDRNLASFKGTEITIDLRASEVGWNLATADAWLGGKLRAETRKRIRDELQRRIFQPLTQWATTGKPAMWWTVGTNNWNAVCLAGVTGAAMANIESRDRRAWFAATAEKYIPFFLSGFTPDGYCSEGVAYWNYGFGHYVMLAETLKRASDGRVDMMQNPQVMTIADYARRVEILPGVFPSFADCRPKTQPNLPLMALLSRRYGWGLAKIEARGFGLAGGPQGLFGTGVYCFPGALADVATAKADDSLTPLRHWFSDAQVLIGRPAPDSHDAIGVAIKGGHNAEQHNHNDVGSYIVALGQSTPLVDPGSEVYTARTFSPKRYDSNVINSFGHAVPRVAGRLQETGRQAAASVLNIDFSYKTDTLSLDLTRAYKVASLKKLERTFEYSRTGRGSLTVTDTVEFEEPQAFGTALITFDPWKSLDSRRLQVGEGPNALDIEITVGGGDVKITSEEIHEDLPENRIPVRVGIDLSRPAKKATIRVRACPQ
jgi:hypothetical protein